MSGPAVAMAAVARGQRGLRGRRAAGPAIIAFSGGVTVLQAQGTRRAPGELVGDLVALRGHGVTDLAGALRAAGRPAGWRRRRRAGGGAAVRLPADHRR